LSGFKPWLRSEISSQPIGLQLRCVCAVYYIRLYSLDGIRTESRQDYIPADIDGISLTVRWPELDAPCCLPAASRITVCKGFELPAVCGYRNVKWVVWDVQFVAALIVVSQDGQSPLRPNQSTWRNRHRLITKCRTIWPVSATMCYVFFATG
jgi:hypothetical protein